MKVTVYDVNENVVEVCSINTNTESEFLPARCRRLNSKGLSAVDKTYSIGTQSSLCHFTYGPTYSPSRPRLSVDILEPVECTKTRGRTGVYFTHTVVQRVPRRYTECTLLYVLYTSSLLLHVTCIIRICHL